MINAVLIILNMGVLSTLLLFTTTMTTTRTPWTRTHYRVIAWLLIILAVLTLLIAELWQ